MPGVTKSLTQGEQERLLAGVWNSAREDKLFTVELDRAVCNDTAKCPWGRIWKNAGNRETSSVIRSMTVKSTTGWSYRPTDPRIHPAGLWPQKTSLLSEASILQMPTLLPCLSLCSQKAIHCRGQFRLSFQDKMF